MLKSFRIFLKAKKKIRPVGRALSPNGIGLNYIKEYCMLSLSNLDYVILNKENSEVTVGAGATVK